MKIAITGANGHIGTRLIKALVTEHDVVAIVRSDSARNALLQVHASSSSSLKVYVADYKHEENLTKAMAGCDAIVHLVGIIKENKKSRYIDAHEKSCQTIIEVAKQLNINRIVYLSIVGSSPDAGNACLFSKGKAEQILLASGIGATVIQVPMVLGEGDFASFAIRKKAISLVAIGFRSASLEQPIYAGDLINAIQSILEMEKPPKSIQLAGPESVSRGELIQRAGQIMGTSPYPVSLPLSLGMALAFLCELLPQPPVTRAMLGVLDHDDNLDVKLVCDQLSLKLTPLDDMLQKVIIS